MFLQYGAEQECSGYLFVLGVRNARATFDFHKAASQFAVASPCDPVADGFGAKGCRGSHTELVFGGAGWCRVVPGGGALAGGMWWRFFLNHEWFSRWIRVRWGCRVGAAVVRPRFSGSADRLGVQRPETAAVRGLLR